MEEAAAGTEDEGVEGGGWSLEDEEDRSWLMVGKLSRGADEAGPWTMSMYSGVRWNGVGEEGVVCLRLAEGRGDWGVMGQLMGREGEAGRGPEEGGEEEDSGRGEVGRGGLWRGEEEV